MNHKVFNEHNIFVIEHKDKIFLYAPLCGILAESDINEINALEKALSTGTYPKEMAILAGGSLPPNPPHPDDLSEITILMNQKCNFACSYCYSARGRDSTELSNTLFDTILNWFLTPSRLEKCGSKKLSVTFSGGGDPLLSFTGIKSLIEKLRIKSLKESIPLHIGLVCNGSLVNDVQAAFLTKYVDDIVISFDVIKEVHNAQRSHYDTVAKTIKQLSHKGINIGLRSTITALNVSRMCEMVRTLADRFPNCKSIAMEAVLAPQLWKNERQLRKFYEQFVTNYFAARRLGETLGICVGNTIDLSSQSIKSRACPGKLSITPDGVLTACSRVATPGDGFFADFIYGSIDPSSFHIDTTRYNKIMDLKADNVPECHSCFARYHCGGGCMLARLSYPPVLFAEYCNFTKAMTINSLTYDLD